ncbi:hypothetical protein FISHEDRAFT_62865 [Fistulina hepatica ATCC 64428]|uniref:Uncharacterized protein n=1 Tax=Fistulina hepatica ATCC 64428 TaxID=1128425 RepID=A0A0D7A071_9AGAR|nr:hypothetical protein FISHEDRAFT_62865 [Fistulina hepatica ATCC 64428]
MILAYQLRTYSPPTSARNQTSDQRSMRITDVHEIVMKDNWTQQSGKPRLHILSGGERRLSVNALSLGLAQAAVTNADVLEACADDESGLLKVPYADKCANFARLPEKDKRRVEILKRIPARWGFSRMSTDAEFDDKQCHVPSAVLLASTAQDDQAGSHAWEKIVANAGGGRASAAHVFLGWVTEGRQPLKWDRSGLGWDKVWNSTIKTKASNSCHKKAAHTFIRISTV